jgi:predicted DNA-binding transcriptional regulator AlpA
MTSSSLSRADSEVFRKLLAEKKKEKGWTLLEVAKILGCSRKTAWNHLQPKCRTFVRAVYAARLSKHVPPDAVAWDASQKVRAGTALILADWRKAEKAPARRKLANRLAAFITESAISLYGLSATTVNLVTDYNAEPDTLTVTLQVSHASVCGSIIINFDHRRRDRIGVVFCDTTGNVKFKDALNKELLQKIYRKVKSWQPAH